MQTCCDQCLNAECHLHKELSRAELMGEDLHAQWAAQIETQTAKLPHKQCTLFLHIYLADIVYINQGILQKPLTKWLRGY